MQNQIPGRAVPINELHVPKILYKYRDYNNSFHLKALFDNEVYIPSANEFNDPLDSKIPFRYRSEDITEENIFKKNLEIIKITHPQLSPERHHALAYENQKKGLLFDEQHIEKFDQKHYQDICTNYGIFCVTPDPTNFLMWSYYANSHKGFCIGYDTSFLIGSDLFSMGGIVDYRDDFPKLPMFPTEQDNLFMNIFYTKWNIWKHENEYRLLHIFKKGKIHTLPTEAISEIVLGCLFSEAEKLKITEQLLKKYPDVLISQTKLGIEDFSITKTELINPNFII